MSNPGINSVPVRGMGTVTSTELNNSGPVSEKSSILKGGNTPPDQSPKSRRERNMFWKIPVGNRPVDKGEGNRHLPLGGVALRGPSETSPQGNVRTQPGKGKNDAGPDRLPGSVLAEKPLQGSGLAKEAVPKEERKSEPLPPKLKAEITRCLDAGSRTLGTMEGVTPETAQKLMLHAERSKELGLELLMARRNELGGKFANITREQLSKNFMEAPLGNLSAGDRALVCKLRLEHQSCLDRLNKVMDNTCDKAIVSKLAAARADELRGMLGFAKETLFKDIDGRSYQQPVKEALNKAFKGEGAPNLEPYVAHLILGELGGHCVETLKNMCQAIASFQRELEILSNPGRGLHLFNTMESMGFIDQKKDREKAMCTGLAILRVIGDNDKLAQNGKPVPHVPKTYLLQDSSKDIYNYFMPIIERPTPQPPLNGEARVGAMLKETLSIPKKVPPKEMERFINATLWKFEQSLRFDPSTRMIMALAEKPLSSFIRAFADVRMPGPGKDRLAGGLLATLLKYQVTLPGGVPKGENDPGFVGKGGQGVTRRATLKLNPAEPEVAVLIKDVLPKTPVLGMLREMLMHGTLQNHPHVPKLIGLGVPENGMDKGGVSLVMEAIPGKDLRKYISGKGENGALKDPLLASMTPMDRARTAVHLVGGAVRALAPMHWLGYAHMDVKPDNIVLDSNSLQARLIDFGNATPPGTPIATTAGYEHINAKLASPATDVYSLGITLLQLASGQSGLVEWPTKLREEIYANAYWNNNPQIKPILDAAKIMLSDEASKRPTTEQLMAIIDGKDVPRASAEKGGASDEDLKVLAAVFGPESAFSGGIDVLAKAMPKA